jgi:hypothetical protein
MFSRCFGKCAEASNWRRATGNSPARFRSVVFYFIAVGHRQSFQLLDETQKIVWSRSPFPSPDDIRIRYEPPSGSMVGVTQAPVPETLRASPAVAGKYRLVHPGPPCARMHLHGEVRACGGGNSNWRWRRTGGGSDVPVAGVSEQCHSLSLRGSFPLRPLPLHSHPPAPL